MASAFSTKYSLVISVKVVDSRAKTRECDADTTCHSNATAVSALAHRDLMVTLLVGSTTTPPPVMFALFKTISFVILGGVNVGLVVGTSLGDVVVMHTPPPHTWFKQSELVEHALPSPHFTHDPPPQSRSVSSPFVSPSPHVGAVGDGMGGAEGATLMVFGV